MNPNDGSWWYVRDGLVDFSYTGMGTGMIGQGIHLTPGISETDRSISLIPAVWQLMEIPVTCEDITWSKMADYGRKFPVWCRRLSKE